MSNLENRLLDLECYVNTKIMHLKPPRLIYFDQHWDSRKRIGAQLTHSLLRIEDERRKLAINHEDKIQKLHDNLLSLLNKHEQIRLRK